MPHTEAPSVLPQKIEDQRVPMRAWGKLIAGALVILLITVACFWIVMNPEWVEALDHWGYLGAFLISLIASATIILPAPGLAIVAAMGVALNPLALSLVAGAGSALGELSGYLAGAGGRALIPERHQPLFERIQHFAESSHAPLAFFLLAALPLPIFDVAGMAAGVMGMRISSFLISVALGKTVKYLGLILLVDYLV
ncbi:MAG: VTT domain-containing protein [Caldilineaceae bacterium]|nr:VTT domain-containing protein [Caldilineaceae bacterium]